LTPHDDGLSGAQSFVDQDLAVERLAHRDGLHRHFVIGADDKDVLPLRSLLDSLERDSQAVVLYLGHDPDVDKHPGPQPAIWIGEDRLETNGARGGIRLVVDRGKRAGIKLSFAVGAKRNDLDGALCESVLHLWNVG